MIAIGHSASGLQCGVKPYKPHHRRYRIEVQKHWAIDGDLYLIDADEHPIVPYCRLLIRAKE